MLPAAKQEIKVDKKILVVEDQGEMRLVLDMILDEKELHADYVSCLLDAGEYLEKNKPSLILLDNQLPDGFGVDFISYARKKTPGVKIIMISGFEAAKDVALENGADMFFEKPFSFEEITRAIDELLDS